METSIEERRERWRARSRAYYAANREREQAQRRKAYAANQGRELERMRKYREAVRAPRLSAEVEFVMGVFATLNTTDAKKMFALELINESVRGVSPRVLWVRRVDELLASLLDD
jgi:hypothetical protein